MSTKDKIINIINNFSDEQLVNVLAMLESLTNAISEAEDDAYCKKLYAEYLDSDDNDETVSIENLATELGVSL